MKSLTIRQILKATKGEILRGSPTPLDFSVNGVSTDTRSINKGNLFIPLVGESFDGHNFIEQAIEKGAAVVLTHRDDIDCHQGAIVIKVANTLKALQDLARFRRSQFDIPVIAITGSNGKTTTKDMIATVLSQEYHVLKTQGNLNNEIGLPLTLLRLEDHHDVAVVEMGMSDLGEIHRLADIARPSVAIITNIGVSHLQNLGTKENILKAKMEIFDFLTSEGRAILNGDDDFLCKIQGSLPFNVEYYGTKDEVHIKASNIEALGEQGVSYDLQIDGKLYSIGLSIPGKHNIYNSLAAVAVGRLMKIEMPKIAQSLKTFRSGDMRLNIFTISSGIKVIDDVYNASPDSMKASIEILKDLGGRRKIAILGDMLELGGYSEKAHIEIGNVLVHNDIDILITVGKDSRFIYIGARDSGMNSQNIIHLDCNKDVIVLLGTMLGADDTILVKGSRGMKMEEIVEYLKVWGNRQ